MNKILNNKKVAIIGGGLSAHLIAYQLLKKKLPVEISIFADDKEIITGPAYKTTLPDSSLMNVPAGNLFLDTDNQLTFCSYIGVDAYTFLPRHLYGEYLLDFFSKTSSKVKYEQKATSLTFENDGYTIEDENNFLHSAHYLVLATGNEFPPFPTQVIDWESLSDKTPIVILGSGLSSVDLVLEIENEALQRKVKPYYKLLSYNGMLPAFHSKTPQEKLNFEKEWLLNKSVKELIALFKEYKQKEIIKDNRFFIDALRPYTSLVFQNLSTEEKKLFLDSYQGYWNVFRHRMAYEVNEQLSVLRFTEKRLSLQKVKNYYFSVDSKSINYETKKGRVEHSFAGLYSTIGTVGKIGLSNNPLIKSILEKDTFKIDEQHLGFEVDSNFQLNAKNDVKIKTAFAMGNLCKGSLWECTAVPELRVQAEIIAARIADSVR